MLDSSDVLLALSGWVAWLAKEIGSKLIDHGIARSGRIGVIEDRAFVSGDIQLLDGGSVPLGYIQLLNNSSVPLDSIQCVAAGEHPQIKGLLRVRVEVIGQFFNDTDTQAILTGCQLEFWGVEGPRIRHSNPEFFVGNDGQAWSVSPTIEIPAHGTKRFKFEIVFANSLREAAEQIEEMYGETVVLLKARMTSGREVSYRICSRSFAGKRKVVWPGRVKYPIFNMYSLNQRGRQAGRQPQDRRGRKEDVTINRDGAAA